MSVQHVLYMHSVVLSSLITQSKVDPARYMQRMLPGMILNKSFSDYSLNDLERIIGIFRKDNHDEKKYKCINY